MIPNFISQVAARLESDVRNGVWNEWLPSERTLAENLQISRKTLRKALDRLRRTGLVETRHGLGHRIVVQTGPVGRASMDGSAVNVALLSPEPIEALRPYTALWVAELAAMLAGHGRKLNVLAGKKYFHRKPDAALRRLHAQHPRHCWILSHSNEAMQRWFNLQGVPCIVTGSCHDGIALPNIDQDHRAVCRHAAGVLRSNGHRRLAMLTERSERAGDLESEAGFAEGSSQATNDAPVMFLRHDGSPESVCKLLDRLLACKPRPTGLLITQPVFYVTAVTHLAQRGLRIPSDLSVMCRDDDAFLAYSRPVPSRYVCTAKTYARKLFKAVLPIAAGAPSAGKSIRILPTYVHGQSISPIPIPPEIKVSASLETSWPVPSVRSSSRAHRRRGK